MPAIRPALAAAASLAATLTLGVAASAAPMPGPAVTASGFSTPESVLYVPRGDYYLVSNINGAPLDKDDNGYLSKVSPSGEVIEERFIDGASAAVTLHAPKGTTILGEDLYVADIDTVRIFDLATGAPKGSIEVPGSTFLNDLTTDGSTVYLTDSGLDATFSPTGADAVYAIKGGELSTVATGDLARPNGVVVWGNRILVGTFGSNTVLSIDKHSGAVSTYATTPGGGLDGLVLLADKTLLVSSWQTSSVYAVAPDGQVTTALTDLPAPADIGIDTRRGNVLVPLFSDNQVVIAPLG